MKIWENITLAKKAQANELCTTIVRRCEEKNAYLPYLGMENARQDLEVRRCIRWNKLVKMEGKLGILKQEMMWMVVIFLEDK
jgi:hypothetical protein